MSEHTDYYEIQSSINPKYGATIYPEDIYKHGAGWYLHVVKDKKALSPADLRKIAGDAVVVELTDECKRLLVKENHYE